MWSLKFSIFDKEGIYNKAVILAGVSIEGLPLNYYQDEKNYYFITTGFVKGTEKQKAKFYSLLKKNSSLFKLEKNKDFFLAITKLSKTKETSQFVHLFYDPKIIHKKPTKIKTDGWEQNEVICFDRKILEKIILISKEKYKFRLKSFKKEKFSEISILQATPKLPQKQLEALQLAIEKNYYTYPRKTNLKKLARISKTNKSTYRENLRKAENKIIPKLI